MTFAVVIPLAALRGTPTARAQITTDPPTTPQPTVPCTPAGLPSENGGAGCGRGPGIQRDVAYAWIDRYCNGDAVPTPPGETTFALNYGLGGQSSGAVQFTGVLTVNGAEVPTQPLATLQPGQKDTRIRTAVVPSDAVFAVTLTGTVISGPNTGQPVVFGNGTDTRLRTASGACPGAPATVPPPLVPTPLQPIVPPVESLPPDDTLPPAR